MCGIVGFFSSNKNISNELIRNMNSAIRRRGPDGEGYHEEDAIALGMRRLAIIDLDHGWQPIYNEERDIVVVFNGEIYNHKQLRKLLEEKGHIFRTYSDTEVLVHLYEEHGIKMIDKLRGMFAFCIWDIAKQKGFVCRDRFGIKPLFYSMAENSLIFASELKSILASNKISKEISPQAIDAFISYNYIPAPLTIYKQAYKLEPGHYIEFSSYGISAPTKYWEPNELDQEISNSDKDLEDEILKSIELHMESDVPVAAFLSGGIDSSLVTVLASKLPIFYGAYTAGFAKSEAVYDERPIAAQVAEASNIEIHKKINISPNPREILQQAAFAFDEPFADDSIFPTWEICKFASQDVKVALTGLGGDELFGGYYRYQGIKIHQAYSLLPLSLRKFINLAAKSIFKNAQKRSINHLLRFLDAGTLPSGEAYVAYLTALPPNARRELINEATAIKIDQEYTKNLILDHFNNCKEKSAVKKAIYTDIKTYVPEDILSLSDRVSMWHSLELRVPLMDHVLFSKCYSMTEKRILSFGEKKRTLRKIARSYLPKSLFQNKKQGFESPMAEWINGELREFVDSQLSREAIENSNIFNFQKVHEILKAHRERRVDYSKIIFSMLSFQVWYQEHFNQ